MRESLVEEAQRLLAEKGTAGFSMHELARRVGVSAAAPYRHFESRGALLGAVAARGYERLLLMLGESLGEGDDPVHDLKLFGLCYMRFAEESPELFEVMFTDRGRGRADEAQRASFAPMTGLVAQAQQAGGMPASVPAEQIARFLWAAAHGLTLLHLGGGFAAVGLDGTAEALVDSAWSALLAQPPGRGGPAV
ncbi:TetR/AcrR family transcriptional regulator [Streptomyces fuscigenes]|uniref:TetR/AcrR family transcriptional regulator n=1 Tax=Streptomyces fuscigenes TaxID=1528880 RepID=UPI001F254630|nr:TetR/AcrR family transcriptional regulator [Streptomyces fuscigenes]MCF3964600.1 TetR/AcrR family transcriptional regulator [Streptomyces fuscigenes]